ncbi:MAG: CHAT domain-containing protein, partial [Betaproteobacteria bacterium]
MTLLSLTASQCAGPDQWHWSLHDVDADGRRNQLLASQPVKLNRDDWQYEAWLDLHGYLRTQAVPDRRSADEQRIKADVGDWIARHVFGSIGPKLVEAANAGPVTVYVTVEADTDKPAGASLDEHVLFRPLELATLDGRPLALHDISLVFDTRPLPARPRKSAPSEPQPLRMLCVFSLPSGVGALNLRHERYQLRRQIQHITRSRGLDVELRVLQYGVTRQTLTKILRDGDGWDIVHFSGHGLASKLILEHDDGSPDNVDTAELIELLKPTRGRLKWVTLSSCLSAAATAEETLRWMGLDPARLRGLSYGDSSADAAPIQSNTAKPTDDSAKRLPVLARALAEQLNCGVLAMRFPVGDEFAIQLAQRVYGGVLEDQQPLHRALRFALQDLCGANSPAHAHPALSVATPTLFGRAALDLSLHPRQSTAAPDADVRQTPLAHFPPAHERLVGRVAELTRASRALATDSGLTGILFQGMAGGGKTACALELVWQQEDVQRFQHFVWYKAPDVGQDQTNALTHFAKALEDQLGGNMKMLDKLDRRNELLAFLPRLVEVLRKHSVLIVVDNLESLLHSVAQPAGPFPTSWNDERWADVIDALLAHDGPSRLVL